MVAAFSKPAWFWERFSKEGYTMTVLQSELDKALAQARASSIVSKPKVPSEMKFTKFFTLYNKKFPDSSCVITQDELDQTLIGKKK
jgi:hypothetical protein